MMPNGSFTPQSLALHMTYDLVIQNGTVINGLGDAPFRADVAITKGIIAEIGKIDASNCETINATGLLVTPGFVDIHTHYDGQATWSSRLSPSSSHGVTTVVMGNCGVGFAPCRPADRESLIRLMEGVEDIPGAVMAEGLPWAWETFPQFMEFLASRRYDIDIAAQLPHAPLRVYVMGQRGLDREPATAADMARMSELTAEAIMAGAIGVATSRSLNHRSSDRHLLPGVSAAEGELAALAAGVKAGGVGVLQCISDFDEPESDFAMLRRIVEKTQIPLSFSLMQVPNAPDRWRVILGMTEQANRDGVPMKGQVFPRPIGAILGLRLSWSFFSFSPSYRALAELPIPERLAAMRDPKIRGRIIEEYPAGSWEPVSQALHNLENAFLMGEQPDYEPPMTGSLGAQARARGLRPVDHAYDLLIADEGKNVFYVPAINYADGNLDAVSTMLRHEHTLLGLGDGGAHVGIICDASASTYMLQRWTGDGTGGTMPLPLVIKALTSDNAHAVNLHDRGVIANGYRADINLIDFERIGLNRPELVRDLPGGAGRLHQRARGYVATIVAGEVTYRDGEPTGQLPGRLVRGARRAPPTAQKQTVNEKSREN
jgi:N-acyl-D-aspartate/D-glutamate deacylase